MKYDIIIGRGESEKKKLGNKGLIFLGKSYVQMGQTTSLSNNVYLDIATSHVLLVSGKRGSGKCLHEDTLITLDDGSIKPIKELENNQRNILCLNNKLKIITSKKTEFYRRTVNNLIKIRLRSGKEIKLTPEHPLLTIKGWVPVEELTLGSRIATPRKTNLFGKEQIEDYKIKLLAYFIAEGHNRKSWVLFSNYDNEIINEFKDCVTSFDKNPLVSLHGKPGCYRVANKNNRYSFKENKMKSWLSLVGVHGKYAKEKEIPKSIFKLKKEKLSLFLNRLFSCDGSIYYNKSRNGWEIDYSSSSKKLIYQVHHLLLKFGILSKIRNKKVKFKKKQFDSYELTINLENSLKFIKEIGFFGEKHEKSKKFLEETKNIQCNPNVDTIPKQIWDLYRPNNWAEVGRFMGYKYPKAMRERIRYCPSRSTLLQISKATQSEPLIMLANSDIFWDEIISMKILEGEFTVYDINVPDYHNFVANDIIVHNSYSLSVIAEEMANLPKEVNKNIAVLLLDTMGIFWSMKYPNERQTDLLKEWGLSPKGLAINIYTPKGKFKEYKEKKIPTDFNFSVKPSELSASDWSNVFDVKITDEIGVLIERTIAQVKKEKKDFSLDDIIKYLQKDKKSELKIRNATENRFEAAKSWGLFDVEGTKIKDILKNGQVSVLDISCYSDWNIKCLVVSILSKKLLQERVDVRKLEEMESIEKGQHYFAIDEAKEGMPLVWIGIDEAHEFLPKNRKTPATDALISLLREGRQPGISLILATQQPGEIHHDVITQSDIVLSHRVTAKLDIEALNSIMQSYLTKDILFYLNNLPTLKGSAIILDDNSERIYPMRVRPKMSWHGGEAPSSVKIKKELFEI